MPQPAVRDPRSGFLKTRAMIADRLDMAHAAGALRAWADVHGTDESVIYDRFFEGTRHSMIYLDEALCSHSTRA